jgi:GNAT superfamily N-acetyltransferase
MAHLVAIDDPSDADRAAIAAPLIAFNTDNGYPPDPQPLAIMLHDESERVVGGLYGKSVYAWLFIELLVVPEALRGTDIGTQLVTKAEQIAIARGCVGAWLTTFTFQARGFYEKLGYRVFGELENSPDDNVRLFMSKRFAAPPVPA